MMMSRRRNDRADRFPEHVTTERDEDGYVKSRRSDLSVWWRAFENLQKYAAAYSIIAAILLSLGFTIVTPKRTRDELSGRIDGNQAELHGEITKLRATVDSERALRQALQHQHDELEQLITIMVRKDCRDTFLSRAEKQFVGLLTPEGFCIR